ncbi:MAG: helix-turn-helix domain-containing protein, partial [Sciscionella sp.]
REVSRAARVSLGYLSEVERGQKEASSELLAAICEALGLPLSELLHYVAADVGAMQRVAAVDAVPMPDASGRRIDGVAAATASATNSAGITGGRIVPPMVGANMAELRLSPALTHPISTRVGPARSGVVVAA